MDHFNIVGPESNPAGVDPSMDSVDDAIDKVMRAPGAIWLTRDDLSAINNKERTKVLERVNRARAAAGHGPTTLDALKREGLCAATAAAALVAAEADVAAAESAAKSAAGGDAEEAATAATRVAAAARTLARAAGAHRRATRPACGGAYRRGFYRVERLMPLEATRRAAAAGLYTMSDNGIVRTLPAADRAGLRVYLDGEDPRHQPYLLNPADALLLGGGRRPAAAAAAFFGWLRGEEAQRVVAAFRGRDPANPRALYEPAHPAVARDRECLQARARARSAAPAAGAGAGAGGAAAGAPSRGA
jgi:hypothetical protein